MKVREHLCMAVTFPDSAVGPPDSADTFQNGDSPVNRMLEPTDRLNFICMYNNTDIDPNCIQKTFFLTLVTNFQKLVTVLQQKNQLLKEQKPYYIYKYPRS